MYNVVTKILLPLVGFFVVSCGASDKQDAEKLLEEAENSINSGNYGVALSLLDSIDGVYPSQVEIRRKAMHIRPKAIEGVTLKELENNDSIIATLQVKYNAISSNFETINDKRLVEPYIIAKKANKSLFETTGIQARITTNGEFYVISSLVGTPIKHTSISFICGSNEVSTSTAKYDGDRNYRSGSTEMITFLNNECDTLGVFARANLGKTITLRFNGVKNKNVKMSKEDIQSFALTHEYASVISDLKSAFRRKEFLDQQLLLARDQIARTLDDSMIDTSN